MKRRNADCGKLRRPMKRNKIAEGMYGSTTILYMKFLVLWAIVITADFMFMFRFEFLWPFWLLLRSVHDSFKYKGLAFSVLFVCIAITSDLVCLFFIPVHWLLFAASTYVWVQYVWHTDKGICLPTIILWMLFVYLEAGIRWKDSRHLPHLDLCRPFAAHCIGYPVVTLGFGFKSYVGYRIRQRKQREVAKLNEQWMQLLRDALPQEEPIVTMTNNDSITSTQAMTSTTTTVTTTTVLNNNCAQNSNSTQQHNNLTNSTCLTSSSPSSMNNIGSTTAATTTTTNSTAQNSHHNHHHHQNSNNSSNHLANGQIHSSSSNSISTNSNNINNGITSTSTSTLNSSCNAVITNAFLNSIPSSSSSLSFNDDKRYEALNMNNALNGGGSGSSNNGGGGATANGHIGGGNSNLKSQRRSADKEHKNRNGSTSSSSANETEYKRRNNNILQQQAESNSNNNNNNNNNYNGKEKGDIEHNNAKEKNDHQRDLRSNSNSSRKSNTHLNSKLNLNIDNHLPQYEIDELAVIEKSKGRRNRSKKDNAASKDNHSHHQQQHTTHNNSAKENGTTTTIATTTNNNNFHLQNSDASSVSSISSTSTTSSTSLTSSATSALTNIATKVVSKICESCLKFEADIKKYRSEISHMKQIENELRQKLESNLTTKSCLQAKQKECDEMEKRILELTNARHADFKASERRLTEERRQKQSLEAQLNNEKKARKLAEEKAARPECSVQCKQRKQQMEEEIKQLRRDIKATEEAKLLAEQHGRKWEQELRMFEAEIRNRDSNQKPTEMKLMNALAAMQDKNCTLEKNLSAETRVKLDLFSALGDAKRQLEISESRRRSKEDEVLDLKAKIAQLLAVMPTDSLCLPACSSTGASSMLRMNDTPPLQTGPGPASPMLTSLNAQATSNVVTSSARVVVPPTSPGDYIQSPPDYVVVNQHNQQKQHQVQQQQQHQQHQQHQQQLQQHLQHQMQQQQQQQQHHHQQQQQQQQCSGLVPVSVANSVLTVNNNGPVGASSLDPNATVYTPKNLQNCPGGVVVVGVTNGEA